MEARFIVFHTGNSIFGKELSDWLLLWGLVENRESKASIASRWVSAVGRELFNGFSFLGLVMDPFGSS